MCSVAPLAGAWIEILCLLFFMFLVPVAPLAGAWIEIDYCLRAAEDILVAPLAGAWIEMATKRRKMRPNGSLPSRERGLKSQGT